jgi:DNA invertase Pin-like site-specific DNA recombinase
MPRAYSYQRFSSLKQRKGDSIRRQTEARDRYLADHPDLVLDTELRTTDAGVSGFRGKNRQAGTALTAFLKAIEDGQVEPGSVLIIENLDRLGRDEVDEALFLFLSILRNGVQITTLEPFREHTKASVGDLAGLLEPIIIMQRAWEESQMKSVRGKAKWKARRDGVERWRNGEPGGKKIVFDAKVQPAWIKPNADKTDFEVDSVAAVIINRLFKLAASGYGCHAIVKKLNDEGVKSIGRGGKYGRTWSPQYIKSILLNRAVIGEFQPRSSAEDDATVGEPVPGYFPAVVPTALFNKVQATIRGRASQVGRPASDEGNLFRGLMIDARDGRRIVYLNCDRVKNRGTDKEVKRKFRYLVNKGWIDREKADDKRPAPNNIMFPYDVFETAFLGFVKELTLEDFDSDKSGGITELAKLLEVQDDVTSTIAATKRKLTERPKGTQANALVDVLFELEQQQVKLQDAIDAAKLKATGHNTRVLKETQSLLDRLYSAEGDELIDLRERIRGRIRALVDKILFLFWERPKGPRGKRKYCYAQVHFFSGQIRVITIDNKFTGGSAVVSEIVPERDLRNYRENPWVPDDVAV